MNRFERKVSFYDVAIGSASQSFDAPATISTARALELMRAIPEAARLKSYKGENEVFYIKDWQVDNGVHHLLVNKCDRLLADPTFSDPKNSTWRTAARQNNEGLDFSSHIVFRVSDNPLEKGMALVENATGLSIVFIQKFFNALMRDAAKINPKAFEFPHPDGSVDEKGNQKQYRTRFLFSFDGHPSNEFIDLLETGSITGIELITERHKNNPLDAQGFVREVRHSLAVKLGPATIDGQRVNTIKSFLYRKRAEFEKARISFTDVSGISSTVKVSSVDFAVDADSIFVKKDVIDGFTAPLAQAYKNLDADIILKMMTLLAGV